MIIEIDEEINYKNKIQNLYSTVFNFKYSYTDISEWYKSSPIHKVKEYILLEENSINAYNYFFPQILDSEHLVYFSGGSMVRPEKKGSFFSFFKSVEKKILEYRCDILFGFPNKYSYPIFSNKFGFGWSTCASFKQIQISGFLEQHNGPSSFIDVSPDDILLYTNQLSSFLRNKKWISWRLKKTGKKYRILQIKNSYVIYSIFKNEIDCLSILNVSDKNKYCRILVLFCEIAFNMFSKQKVNIFCSDDFIFDKIKTKFVFNENPYKRYFCYKSMKDDKLIGDSIFVEMLDCDTF